MFRDGVVVTVFAEDAEDAEVDDLVDEAVEVVEEQPAGDPSVVDRARNALENVLESLSLG